MSIKSVGAEGVTTETSWTAEIKGFGRMQGIEGRSVGTSTGWQRPDGITDGTAQGIFTAKDGDTGVWKSHSMGKIEAGKNKIVSLITFRTVSQKLSWMNSLVAISEGEIDPNTQEISGTGYEWK